MACSATARALRQVAAHQERVQLFPVGLPVIPFTAPNRGKSGPFVKPPGRLIIFLDFEEYRAHAAPGEVAEMGQQKVAGEATAAMAGGNGDGEYFGLVRRHARNGEADDPPSHPQAMDQRVALGQHALEFAFTPSAVKRCAVKLREYGRV